MMRWLVAVMAALLLAGCGSQQAGYQIDGAKHALSVTRTQDYPMSNWSNYVVVARYPACQRRYPLRDSGDYFKMNVYQVRPGVYVLYHSKRWYVAETQGCQWQQFPEPPPEPGELIGSFKTKAGELVWIPAKDDGDSADE